MNQAEALKQKWAKTLSLWKSTGKTMKEWCKQNNVVYSQFFYWKQRLTNNKEPLQEKSSFTELIDKSMEDSGVSLECNGIKIYLSKDFDSHTFYRCIHLLQREKLC